MWKSFGYLKAIINVSNLWQWVAQVKKNKHRSELQHSVCLGCCTTRLSPFPEGRAGERSENEGSRLGLCSPGVQLCWKTCPSLLCKTSSYSPAISHSIPSNAQLRESVPWGEKGKYKNLKNTALVPHLCPKTPLIEWPFGLAVPQLCAFPAQDSSV